MVKRTRREFVKGAFITTGAAIAAGCSSQGTTGSPKTEVSPNPYRIAFVTDLHFSGEKKHEEMWQRLLARLAEERVDFVLGGGDWITEGAKISRSEARDRLSTFAEIWSRIPHPKALIPGNHDLARSSDGSALTMELFQEVFPEWRTNNRIDLPNLTILTVQSVFPVDGHYKGYIGRDQVEWLQAQLQGIPLHTPLAIATHIPFLTGLYQRTMGVAFQPPADQYVENSVEVLNQFSHHNLQLVFQGHLHVHEVIQWQHTSFVTGGAVCGRWWRGDHHGTPPGFRVVEVGKIGIGRYVSLGG